MIRFVSLFHILMVLLATSSSAQVSEPPFAYVEVMPTFQGGQVAMYKYIADHIVYPDSARQNNIQGTVVAQFVVDIDSLAKEIKIIRGISGGCNEEVLRLFDMMNVEKRWIPGTHNNKPVPVLFTLPVKFVLKGNEKKQSKNSNSKSKL